MSLGMGETDRQTNGSQHCTMPPYGRGITITHTTQGYLHWVSFKHQRTAANWTHYHWNVSTSAVSASASYTPTAAQPFNFHATQKPLIYVHLHTDMPTIPAPTDANDDIFPRDSKMAQTKLSNCSIYLVFNVCYKFCSSEIIFIFPMHPLIHNTHSIITVI